MVSKKKTMIKQRKHGHKDKVPAVNPFELKINRQKYDILGRKLAKTEKGMPGMSRSKALKKRKETLLVEYKKIGRSNKIVDQRIGEHDIKMSLDEKMAKRFALERQRELTTSVKKKSLTSVSNSDDSSEEEVEELTHFGQSLSEMENFKDPVMSDVDNDSDDGRINAKTVGEEHFGGFLTKRAVDDADVVEKPKSWKEKMEEVIARSKLAKLERQNEREKTLEAVKNVDTEWKELQMLVSAIKRNRETAAAEKAKDGDYDVVMRQLQFDLKAKATDRLKSEEEIAKEEKERLEKLEADRLQRMHGYCGSDKSSARMSADDLDDGLVFASQNTTETEAGDEENDESSEEDDDNDDDDDADDSEDDSMSDIESGVSEDDKEEASPQTPGPPLKKQVRFIDGDVNAFVEPQVTAKFTKEEIVSAANELPYTFPAPANYSELSELLQGHSEENCLIIIDRIVKCHHASLAEGNKAKLATLCRVLMRYFVEVARHESPSQHLLDGLTVYLYKLTRSSSSDAGEEIISILTDLHSNCFKNVRKCTRQNGFPGLDVLLTLQLVSLLFPTSDRRHPVVTPAMLFMSRMLNECPINSTVDVASGLFICTLFADYISMSKRYVPEVVSFMESVLLLAHGENATSTKRGKQKDSLKLSKDLSVEASVPCCNVSISQVLTTEANDEILSSDHFKLRLINQCLRLAVVFADIYRELPAFSEIFERIRNCCHRLPVSFFPTSMKTLTSELISKISPSSLAYKPLIRPASKPQALKLLEPRIRENFDGRKKLPGSKSAREKAALKVKTKREFKGALREIRKDTQFIARHRLTEQIERDTERKLKVQRLLGDLAQQEGECRAFKKKK